MANRAMRRAIATKKRDKFTAQEKYDAIRFEAIKAVHTEVAEVICKDSYYRCLICMLEVLCKRFSEIRTKEGREQKSVDMFFEEMAKLKIIEPEIFDYEGYLAKHFGVTHTHFQEVKELE